MRATASLALLGLLLQADIVFAQDQPLHLLIDKHLSPASSESVLCSDAEFFRRVSLDLMGAPPTAADVRAFVADE